MFSGRYDAALPSERPVYGAWNRRGDRFGGAVRFGSSYVRLRPDVVERLTFCFPDSVLDPLDVGDVSALDRLCLMADEAEFDHLDDYVEVHVHGGVRFADDVDAVVPDPRFMGTDVETVAQWLGCRIEFHKGSPLRRDPPGRKGGAHLDERSLPGVRYERPFMNVRSQRRGV